MEAVDAVGELLGDDLFHRLQIAGVVTESAQRLAVYAPHLEFGMRIQEVAALLHHTVGEQREMMLMRFVHRIPQGIACAQTGSDRQQFGLVVGIVAVARPENNVLRMRRKASPDDLSPIEAGRSSACRRDRCARTAPPSARPPSPYGHGRTRRPALPPESRRERASSLSVRRTEDIELPASLEGPSSESAIPGRIGRLTQVSN